MPTPPPFSTWVLNVFLSAGRRLLDLLRADHRSIHGGAWQQNLGGRTELFFAVSCAPSRSFRKPRRVGVLEALAFLNELLPDGFSSPATTSHDRFVAFETKPIEEEAVGFIEPLQVGIVNFNGRVEFAIRAPLEKDGEEAVVDLAAAFAYLYRFVELVNHGHYQRLYRLPTKLRRLDWFVALGNNYQHRELGSRTWTDLRFPGSRPAHRATNGFPWFDNNGLAWERLRSKKQRVEPAEVLRPTLVELIDNSGWYDGVAEAAEETIPAAASASRRNSPIGEE